MNTVPHSLEKCSLKSTVVYDPAKSETYKFLQEQELGDHIQEVVIPPQPKVFTPNKVPPARVSCFHLIRHPALLRNAPREQIRHYDIKVTSLA